MKKIFIYMAAASLFLTGCSTTQSLEFSNELEEKSETASIEEEEQLNEQEVKNILIQEELKVQDVKDTVVVIRQPVYIPEEKPEAATDFKKLQGQDAVKDSLDKAVQKPENYRNGTFFYDYNEDYVYEVYAQPYQLTDIVLESGEIVIGTPLLSEDESVWELTANVARNPATGEDIQHLFVKPAYSKLDSTLVIITDRRVYHFRLRSFSDTHMAMVKFTYPLEKNVWAKKQNPDDGRSIENNFIRTSNPELLSFDYQIKYSKFKKPEFLPERIYDDGQCTYIQVEDVVLQKKLPVIFNEKNEIVNYSVHGNVFIIPRLINTVTLRLGKEKVVVQKKITEIAEEQEVQD